MRNIAFLIFLSLLAFAPQASAIDTSRFTAQDVEAFLDGLVPLQLEREDIAGAVVVVVKDGQIFFAKGYGFADVEKRKPVSPSDTLFRPGSVSKLFTWTAVMQLVEQGKLDLDRDINQYIDFKMPDTHSKPITLQHLMTHTPGFEDAAKDLFVAKPSDLQPLSKYLPAHLPHQIFPPGSTSAYSNYGTALAGYIIERVSGRPHADYVQEFILKPLNMQRSTFVQPLPKNLQPLMSRGYTRGSEKPGDFELVNAAPAGSLSSTGNDMAAFMIAHLQQGSYGNAQILRPETAKLMHSKQFSLHPKANGMALGFYEESRNGVRIIGHGGDTLYFHSDLHLIQDANLGFFVSYNSGGRGESSAREALWGKFLDRYFPYSPPASKAQPTAKQHSKDVSGLYQISRREESTILQLIYGMFQLKVSEQADGTIELADFKGFNGKPKRWREVEPFTYEEVNGQERIYFIRRQGGDFELVIPYPFMSYQRVTFFNGSLFLKILVISTAAILALAVLLWPVAALIRWHYGKRLTFSPRERRYRILTRLVCLVMLVFLIVFGAIIVSGFESLSVFSSKMDTTFRMINILGLIGAVGALIALYNVVLAWRNPERGRWSRFTESAIALGCVGYVWILIAGNLFFFNLRY